MIKQSPLAVLIHLVSSPNSRFFLANNGGLSSLGYRDFFFAVANTKFTFVLFQNFEAFYALKPVLTVKVEKIGK